jgi:hypothetical protein
VAATSPLWTPAGGPGDRGNEHGHQPQYQPYREFDATAREGVLDLPPGEVTCAEAFQMVGEEGEPALGLVRVEGVEWAERMACAGGCGWVGRDER